MKIHFCGVGFMKEVEEIKFIIDVVAYFYLYFYRWFLCVTICGWYILIQIFCMQLGCMCHASVKWRKMKNYNFIHCGSS